MNEKEGGDVNEKRCNFHHPSFRLTPEKISKWKKHRPTSDLSYGMKDAGTVLYPKSISFGVNVHGFIGFMKVGQALDAQILQEFHYSFADSSQFALPRLKKCRLHTTRRR